MNINKFTQKSMQAVQDCEKLAYQYGNQEIDQEHLIVALLHQEDSLFAKLITNDGELAHRLLSPKKHVDKTYYK